MIRHISTSIEGILNMRDSDLEILIQSVTDYDGNHPASVQEFRQALSEELTQGHRFLRALGCDNFDPVHGCLGHPPKVYVPSDDLQ